MKTQFILKYYGISKLLICWYFKTTGLILVKITGYNVWTDRALYTNFQSNLKFYKNIETFSFNGYRWFLLSCICLRKLKESPWAGVPCHCICRWVLPLHYHPQLYIMCYLVVKVGTLIWQVSTKRSNNKIIQFLLV